MIAYQYRIHIEEEALEAAFGSESMMSTKREHGNCFLVFEEICLIFSTLFRTKLSKSELFQKVILNE
jgi:hypothetical protein